ncbi:hypothetical protein DLAC_07720 [Tieghemostelium lacteum]|uniref:Uncharacterized protein n=1 Tax=Tieghemostelium lacteum TaxID=361077 RepID=A0A151ZA73_TIELA|nr:hypothetical protein DLAC_07720 [Tieghemostelium lacteum]|eukprot:KYQ90849.1 hypothetical protein DLAC_07720 [Tieghemostelium lacteum]
MEELFFRVWRNKYLINLVFCRFNKSHNFYSLTIYDLFEWNRVDLLKEILRVHRINSKNKDSVDITLSDIATSKETFNHYFDLNSNSIRYLFKLLARDYHLLGVGSHQRIERNELIKQFYRDFRIEMDLYISRLFDNCHQDIVYILEFDMDVLNLLILNPSKSSKTVILFGIAKYLIFTHNYTLAQWILLDPSNQSTSDLFYTQLMQSDDKSHIPFECAEILDLVLTQLLKFKTYSTKTIRQRFYNLNVFSSLASPLISNRYQPIDILKVLIEKHSYIYKKNIQTLPYLKEFKLSERNLETFYYMVKQGMLATTLINFVMLYNFAKFDIIDTIRKGYEHMVTFKDQIFISLDQSVITVENMKLIYKRSLNREIVVFPKDYYATCDNLDVLKYALEHHGNVTLHTKNISTCTYEIVEYFFSQKPYSNFTFNCDSSSFRIKNYCNDPDKRIFKLILGILDNPSHMHRDRIIINSLNYILLCGHHWFAAEMVKRNPKLLESFHCSAIFDYLSLDSVRFVLDVIDHKGIISLIARKHFVIFREWIKNDRLDIMELVQNRLYGGSKLFSVKDQFMYSNEYSSYISPEMFELCVDVNWKSNIAALERVVNRVVKSNNLKLIMYLYENFGSILLSKRIVYTIFNYNLIVNLLKEGSLKMIKYLISKNHPMFLFHLILTHLSSQYNLTIPPTIIDLIQFKFQSLDTLTKDIIFYNVTNKSLRINNYTLLRVFITLNFKPSFPNHQPPKPSKLQSIVFHDIKEYLLKIGIL